MYKRSESQKENWKYFLARLISSPSYAMNLKKRIESPNGDRRSPNHHHRISKRELKAGENMILGDEDELTLNLKKRIESKPLTRKLPQHGVIPNLKKRIESELHIFHEPSSPSYQNLKKRIESL